MRDAVIVSTARTPIGKAYRGAFNNTPSQTLAGHVIEHVRIQPVDVDRVALGETGEECCGLICAQRGTHAVKAGAVHSDIEDCRWPAPVRVFR